MDHTTVLQKEVLILRTDIETQPTDGYAERADRQLVELVLAGDEAAFECIFEKHKRRIAVLAGRFFREPSEVEEIIQITFTRAFTELRSFRGAHDFSLASWLNRIATNACLNLLKARRTKIETLVTTLSVQEIETLAVDLRSRSPEDLIVQRDLLEKLLGSLAPDDRVLLQMLYAEQMSVKDVAGIFGWSRAKVKVRAFRARRSLGKVLKRFL